MKSTKPRAQHTKDKVPPSSYRYLFFGGKGGVGKTTSATATAFYLLQRAEPNNRILLFSTDPAHSLADSIDKRIGNRPTEVANHSGAKLFAYEMDATAALERFRTKHGKVLVEIAERGTFLDEADINELLSLSLPGLDEVMSLFELSELHRTGKYDRIIVDTAPSGHTTRLLRLPQVFTRMVSALDRMSDKHRYIMAQFSRRRVLVDEVDQFLTDLNERIARVIQMLKDPGQTSFSLVTIPEALSVRETERYLEVLEREQIPVTDLIVNRVESEHEGCGYCHARVLMQRPSLAELRKSFKGFSIHLVPLFPNEVRGATALKKFGRLIWDQSIGRESTSRGAPRTRILLSQSEGDFPMEARKVVIFGGKGGVGKTTAAAAFALALAKKDTRRRVLIFSTDPAHSLADSFDEPIGELKRNIGGLANLDGMEIDPGRWFDDLKRRYQLWIDDLFASLSGGSKLEIRFDREAMRELVELSPPGIDEIAALGSVSELLEGREYDTIVLDSAPTGHLIRFLELPQVALSWVRTFIKLLLKYQHIVHATRIAEELVTMSKSVKRVSALLTDPESCEFVAVAIPERMSLEETRDLREALGRLKIPMQKLLLNGLVPEEASDQCAFCGTRRRKQLEMVKEFKKSPGNTTKLFVAPQQARAVQGTKDLQRHFASWRSLAYFAPATDKRLRSGRAKVKNVR